MSSNSTIAKQVVSELEIVQNQLTTFKSAVAYLNEAKSNVNTAVSALRDNEAGLKNKIQEFNHILETANKLKDSSFELVNKIDSIDFPLRLNQIEETVRVTIKEIEASRKVTVRELEVLVKQVSDVDFASNFENLKDVVRKSAKSNSEFAEAIEKQNFLGRIDKFQGNVELLLKDSFEKLDGSGKKTAADTLKIVQELNLPIRIDKLDANIAGIQVSIMNIANKTDNLERDIREQFNKLNQHILDQDKIRRSREVLILGLGLFSTIGVLAVFYLLLKVG